MGAGSSCRDSNITLAQIQHWSVQLKLAKLTRPRLDVLCTRFKNEKMLFKQ